MFEVGTFGEPAWDMMLKLFVAQSQGRSMPVKSLCIASAVPLSTAARWIKLMVLRGLFDKTTERRDGRSPYVALTPQAFDMIQELLLSNTWIGDVDTAMSAG
jgi:DNA-binding MarR family transcriptional regulator